MAASDCIAPAGSLGTRPVKNTDGRTVPLETLYPKAMSPAWSMAILPIHREAAVGLKVPCWKTVGVPLGFRISYQRIPVVMECVATMASWPSANFLHANRYIKRSASESSLVVVL